MEKTNNKKRYGVIALVLVALLASGVGTWAWLQATDQVENEFTVGKINKPTVTPDPGKPIDPDNPYLSGYLFETEWVNNSKMVPDTDIKKNPNVGIGKDSDESYVFIYVKNAIVKDVEGALTKTPYFTLNTNWKPVPGTFKGQAVDNGTPNEYVSGLFMYADNDGSAKKLQALPGADSFTGSLFDTVHIPAAMNSTDVVTDPAMTVSCYIFGANQKGDKADAATNAVEQAKAWAAEQAK